MVSILVLVDVTFCLPQMEIGRSHLCMQKRREEKG
jgi:hypothetical protein